MGTETLNEDEVTIISSVLELSHTTVARIMTPIADTYTLPSDAILDQEMVNEVCATLHCRDSAEQGSQILALGHSRIPIFAPGNRKAFVGMLIVVRLSLPPAEEAR